MANYRPVTIPALGRQFSLGNLYDLSTHQIHTAKLWDEEELTDEKLTIQEIGSSHFSIEVSNSQDDRCNALDVEATIKLDIFAGALDVEGSAKYVNASNSSSKTSSVTYVSKKMTKTKCLNMSHFSNITYQSMLEEEKEATHVVSAITYGKMAFFKFEAGFTDEWDKDQINGRLKLAAIAMIRGEGVNESSDEKMFADETSCKFFGDYTEIIPPLTLAEAKDTFLAIEEDETNSLGVPISVTLTPLSSLTSSAVKNVDQLSANAVNEALRLFQDIEDIQVSLKTPDNGQASAEYFETMRKIAFKHADKESLLKSKLCEILPKVKENSADEQELMKIIAEYDESPFGKAKTYGWLNNLLEVGAKKVLDDLAAL